MMHSTIWALFMALGYAASNLMIERKLSTVQPLALMTFNYVVLLTMSFTLLIGRSVASGATAPLPTGNLYVWIIAWAAIVLAADFCFFKAYHSGGSVVLVTMLIIFFIRQGRQCDG